MNRLVIALLIVLLGVSVCRAADSLSDLPQKPFLLNPLPGDYYTGGAEKIEFKWRPQTSASGISDQYDFRIFKGSALNDENLMWEDTLEGDRYQYNMDSERFQDNEVYTWAIRQAHDDSTKSDWSVVTFRIIKK